MELPPGARTRCAPDWPTWVILATRPRTDTPGGRCNSWPRAGDVVSRRPGPRAVRTAAENSQTIVHLIARTTTAKGLTVICRLDRRKYPTGRKISDEEMKQVNLTRGMFHGDWNYVIRPKVKRPS